jgi:hypothetical protein
MTHSIEHAQILHVDISLEEHGYLVLDMECDCHGKIQHFRHFDVDAAFLKELFSHCKVEKMSECIGKFICLGSNTISFIELYPVLE